VLAPALEVLDALRVNEHGSVGVEEGVVPVVVGEEADCTGVERICFGEEEEDVLVERRKEKVLVNLKATFFFFDGSVVSSGGFSSKALWNARLL